ncbi:response regulator transcription factor [Wenzhouxiangella marina]|uniref:Transcriptional regulator, LuxR family n=1 Tax=Wenzhouxiangella marina TaxID=1579979 RepID=A0A0K0XYU8_9GAMM|nr:response regulator transcription factor [Wenzhouxiangella marina]AKS42869.1 Transcriptional regulator, LuxR family [Wenzhouxiangella marina]MBB6087449.1 DNA-binding NarL/FixJ family response regulator [Wenzhouxiangella marina]
MSQRQVIVADDHPLFREALALALERALGGAEIIQAGNMAELELASREHDHADLVLLDLHMPGVQGFSALIYLRAHHPELPVCVISANNNPVVIQRAMDHGAAAFIHKSAPVSEIREVLDTVLAGDIWQPRDGDPAQATSVDELETAERIGELTPQQFRVLMMVAEGLLNKQIAYELDISEATVKAHMTAILRKLGVTNRTQAVLLAQRLAVEPPEAGRGDFPS